MNLEKVFIGYTKDGKERCLYKKNKSYVTNSGIVNCTVYEDVESREEFNVDHVDLASLLSFTYSLQIEKRQMLRRKVKKVYQADRNKLIDVRGAFYGNVIDKCILRKVVQDCDIFMGIGKDKMNTPVEDILKRNVLFARTYDSFGHVQDLHNSKIYNSANKVSYGIAAKETRPVNYQIFDKSIQPKRKVLEMDYRKEL